MIRKTLLIASILLIPLFAFLTSIALAEGVAQKDYQGQLVSPTDSSAVYYISADSESYSFSHERIYFSWFANFDYVQNINPAELEQYKYKGKIQYKPQAYENLNYILIDGTLVKQIDGPGYFYINNGKKRVFTTMEVFESNGFQYENAIIADVSNYPWGVTIGQTEEELLNTSEFIEPLIKEIDTDQDGLNDYDEKYFYHTEVNKADTDGDGMNDGEEINNKQSPLSEKKLIEVDTDQDYLNDYFELKIGTDLMNPDTDGDLYLDGTEVAASHDPFNPNPEEKIEKLIKVNIAEQKLEYYFGGKLIDSFLISSGTSGMDTPTGEFSILGKEDSKRYGGPGYDFDYPDTKWNLHFYTGQYRFYIHGAYWHDNFGSKMSHGCVNVHYDNMEYLYWFTDVGTKVIIE
jgi:L,D-transpeptidase-like protein/thrombospondin type 3 repeat protein